MTSEVVKTLMEIGVKMILPIVLVFLGYIAGHADGRLRERRDWLKR